VSLRRRSPGLVPAGGKIRLSGRLQSRKRGKRVKLEYKPAGGPGKVIERLRTGKEGRFVIELEPRFNGTYRARAKGSRSPKVPVEVKPVIELDVERATLEGDKVGISGELRPASGGRKVVIERQSGNGWSKLKTVKAGRKGFEGSWKPKRRGEYRLRARFKGDARNRGARQKDKANVYRKAVASHYGKGFYGSRTACGKRLKRKTLGVAHRQVPCGAKVTFLHRGRSVRVPVIDRGPFVRGRDWDLTTAAAKKLRVNGVAKIWATR
jgi:hypothetical protein